MSCWKGYWGYSFSPDCSPGSRHYMGYSMGDVINSMHLLPRIFPVLILGRVDQEARSIKKTHLSLEGGFVHTTTEMADRCAYTDVWFDTLAWYGVLWVEHTDWWSLHAPCGPLSLWPASVCSTVPGKPQTWVQSGWLIVYNMAALISVPHNVIQAHQLTTTPIQYWYRNITD